MKITVYRYLGKELLSPFLLGLFGFTFVLTTGRILQLAEWLVNMGIPLSFIGQLLYLLLPSLLVLTIPMATLLAILLAFNRLSSDNEITALKASGISLYQLLPPVLILSLGAYGASAFLSFHTLPQANFASRLLFYEMASSRAHIGIQERVFNDDFEGLVLYVDRVFPKSFRWEGVFISDSRNPAEVNTIIAPEGIVYSEPEQLTVTLRLRNGAIHKLSKEPEVYQKVDFDTYDLRLDLRAGWKQRQDTEKKPSDMSFAELRQTIQKLRSKQVDPRPQLVKIHEKFSIPFACLVFGLIGIPLGLQSRTSRSGRSMGFAWSIGVLLVYYLLTTAGTSLAERAVLPMVVGMWAPNGLFLGFGIYLLVKTVNESPVRWLVWLNRKIKAFRRGWRGLGRGAS